MRKQSIGKIWAKKKPTNTIFNSTEKMIRSIRKTQAICIHYKCHRYPSIYDQIFPCFFFFHSFFPWYNLFFSFWLFFVHLSNRSQTHRSAHKRCQFENYLFILQRPFSLPLMWKITRSHSHSLNQSTTYLCFSSLILPSKTAEERLNWPEMVDRFGRNKYFILILHHHWKCLEVHLP